MPLGRVAAYVDGFNLYHAIKRLRQPHFLWLDLWTLSERFIQGQTDQLIKVAYFSAYADWLAPQAERHRAYVSALESTGVTAILGRFKEKTHRCSQCKRSYQGHEEKESDVNIALHLLADATDDVYDTAFILSRDSDLVPAMRMVKARHPTKQIILVAPPQLGHSSDMLRLADGKRKIQEKHLAACQLPDVITLSTQAPIHRPARYKRPAAAG